MSESTIELLGLRHFGPDTPLAVLQIGTARRFYDLAGVRDLMQMYEGRAEYAVLAAAERLMLTPGQHPDINEEDFSGQEQLF